MAHVVVTEGLVDREFVAERCEPALRRVGRVHRPAGEQPRGGRGHHRGAGRRAAGRRPALRRPAGNAAIYYGLGVTEHSQGSTMVMGMANLAMATGNIGREGVGVNPLRGQNNVQGSCDMGSFPHELPGLPARVRRRACARCSRPLWGRTIARRAGPAHPEHVRRRHRRHLPGPLRPGRGHRPVRPEHPARQGGAARDGPARRPGPVPQRDREVRARLPARARRSWRRTARSPTPSAASTGCARSCRRRPASRSGRSSATLAPAMGYPMNYDHAEPDHGRDRR